MPGIETARPYLRRLSDLGRRERGTQDSVLSTPPQICVRVRELLTCPVHSPTTRSAMKVSSVSPERCDTMTPHPLDWASLHLGARENQTGMAPRLRHCSAPRALNCWDEDNLQPPLKAQGRSLPCSHIWKPSGFSLLEREVCVCPDFLHVRWNCERTAIQRSRPGHSCRMSQSPGGHR